MPHGNPHILLPRDHAGGCLSIADSSSQVVIWCSERIAPGTAGVCVDVWHGSFQREASGWSLLSPGSYRVLWTDMADHVEVLEPLHVNAVSLFDETFTAHCDVSDWLICGEWEHDDGGLSADEGEVFLFREGAMHGELTASYKWHDVPQSSIYCGLVIRHYNASAHLRLECVLDPSAPAIRLVQLSPAGTPDGNAHVIAEETLRQYPSVFKITWRFNGDRHEVLIDDHPVLNVVNGFMGGVDIVGVFAVPGARLMAVAMNSTQWTPRLRIEREDYAAEIRPGNIRHLSFLKSLAPSQNVFWESGLQFGHIGGSEIKFTQGARLTTTAEGPVATTVTWTGPMPRFVEQAQDVRGHAWGKASFFRDRIVVCDEVLTWVQRSVGPDLDILSRLLAGPVRAVVGDERQFRDWDIDSEKAMSFLMAQQTQAFPICIIMPMRLGESVCWLLAMIHLSMPLATNVSGTHFAWHCPRKLTGSYDFRAAPTVPGQLYRFEIVLGWCIDTTEVETEAKVLNLRDDWFSPMTLTADVGRVVRYEGNGEQPREALYCHGGFDRSVGVYRVEAKDDRCVLTFDPADIERRHVVVVMRGLSRRGHVHCTLDGTPLCKDRDIKIQRHADNELWLQLMSPLTQVSCFEVTIQ